MFRTEIMLNNGLLKLFKIWLSGYIIGVILAVCLFRLQEHSRRMTTRRRPFIEEPKSYYLDEPRNLDDLSEESLIDWKVEHWIPQGDDYIPQPSTLRKLEHLVHTHKGEDRTVATAIAKKVRVFCIVMTVKDRHRKAQIIKKSWGKKCDKILVMSTLADKSVPTIALKREEDDLYNDLWNRDMEAFRYVYLNHKNEADWFIKTDDETYVIMENLKYMLKSYSSSEAVYFRCMQARQVLLFQAGYVFSKEALKIFAKRAHECNVTDSNNILIGKCLQYLNITKLDSRDSEGRDRMFPYSPPFLGLSSGASDYAISFHNVTDIFTFLLEYFVYHLKPFGIVANYQVPDRDE